MSLELHSVPELRRPSQGEEEEANSLIQTLPPVDRGAAAWKCLIASSVIEGVLWGMSTPIPLKVPSLTERNRLSLDVWCLSGLLLAPARV